MVSMELSAMSDIREAVERARQAHIELEAAAHGLGAREGIVQRYQAAREQRLADAKIAADRAIIDVARAAVERAVIRIDAMTASDNQQPLVARGYAEAEDRVKKLLAEIEAMRDE